MNILLKTIQIYRKNNFFFFPRKKKERNKNQFSRKPFPNFKFWREHFICNNVIAPSFFSFLSLIFFLSWINVTLTDKTRRMDEVCLNTRNMRQSVCKVSNFPRSVPAFSFSRCSRATVQVTVFFQSFNLDARFDICHHRKNYLENNQKHGINCAYMIYIDCLSHNFFDDRLIDC